MVFVRRNVYSLDPNGPEIASLRQGIQVMQSRSMDDPTSWMYQACIHGTYDPVPAGAAWNQCQHGNFCFLSWLDFAHFVLVVNGQNPLFILHEIHRR